MSAKNDLLQSVSDKYVNRAASFGIPEELSRKHYISGVKPDLANLSKEAKAKPKGTTTESREDRARRILDDPSVDPVKKQKIIDAFKAKGITL
jgi:hypothetical protein